MKCVKERKDTISRALGVQVMVRKRCNHEGCVTQTHIVKGGVCVSHIWVQCVNVVNTRDVPDKPLREEEFVSHMMKW